MLVAFKINLFTGLHRCDVSTHVAAISSFCAIDLKYFLEITCFFVCTKLVEKVVISGENMDETI